MMAYLTLEKAITTVRQAEQIHQQQGIVRGPTQSTLAAGDVDIVKRYKPKPYKGKRDQQSYQPKVQSYQPQAQTSQSSTRCKWNGGTTKHDRQQCPARNAKCRSCKKTGHWSTVCRSTKSVNSIQGDNNSDSYGQLDAVFLEALTSGDEAGPWTTTIRINDSVDMLFKLDTDADVTVISTVDYSHLESQCANCQQKMSDKVLYSANSTRLDVLGVCDVTLRYKQRSTNAAVYVVRHVSTRLLGRDVISKLNLLAKVDEVSDTGQRIKSQLPELFRALGCMQGKYTICLKSDSQPFAITVPHKVAYPLIQPLRKNSIVY